MQTHAVRAAPRCDAEGWHHFSRSPWFMDLHKRRHLPMRGKEQQTKVSLWRKVCLKENGLLISNQVHDSGKENVSKRTRSKNPITSLVKRHSNISDLFYMSKTRHCQQYTCQTFLFTQVWMCGREQKAVIAASRWCNRPRCVGSALLIWVKAYAKGPYWWVTEPSMPWPHQQHSSPHWQARWCVQHDSKATLLLLCVMSPKGASKHRGAACLRKLRLSWDNRWLQASRMPISQCILAM